MSQTGLARRLGWTQPAVGALVSGTKTASLARWQQIAEALGVDPSEFFASPVERVTVEVAGAKLTGPEDVVSRVLAVVGMESHLSSADLVALRRPEMQEPKARPSERHTGLHVVLDAVDAGEFADRYGFPLAPNDELGLRTYGRSGPVVTTEAEALDAPGEVLRVRAGLAERIPVGV